MAAGVPFAFNPDAAEDALNVLQGMHSAIESCSADSANHSNWVSNLILDVEHTIEDAIGALRNAVEDVWNRAEALLREHLRLHDLLETTFGAARLPSLVEEHFSSLQSHLNSGHDNLSEALRRLGNPLDFVRNVVANALSYASRLLGEAVNAAEQLKTTLENIKEHVQAMIAAANRRVNNAAPYIMESVRKGAQTLENALSLRTVLKRLLKIDEGPFSLGEFLESVDLKMIVGMGNPADFNILRTIFGEVVEEGSEGVAGWFGLAAIAITAVPGAIAAVAQGFGALDTVQSLSFGADTILGQAYKNVANAWNQLAIDANTLGEGFDNLFNAFGDIHGLTILAATAPIIGLVGLTIFTGGLDLPAIALAAAVGSEIAAAESPVVVPLSLQAEQWMGLDPSKARTHFDEGLRDLSAAPRMLRDAVDIAGGEIKLDALKIVTVDGLLNRPMTDVHKAMLNAAYGYQGAR